jgi:hypothetical protein
MYFNSRHGCIKGDACQFLHVDRHTKQQKTPLEDPESGPTIRKVVMNSVAVEEEKKPMSIPM